MSTAATYKDRRKVEAKPYAPGGCPIHVGKQKCGETVGLDIIMDFHKLYQEKMSEIDVSAGGDSLQEKVNLQEQWIEDLTAQNKLLARVIEELESETIDRVQKLEDKLNNAVKSFGEDGSRALEEKEKKIEKLEDNLKVLPAAEEDLKKITEESERLKQAESEKEIKSHYIPETHSEEGKPHNEKPLHAPEKLVEIVEPVDQSDVSPCKTPSTISMRSESQDKQSVDGSPFKQKTLSKASFKSVHLILGHGKNGSHVVEPEKDLTVSPDYPEKPPIDGVPVVGTQDSLELQGKSPQVLEKQEPVVVDDNVCVCETKDYWQQLDKLKEENKMLREGNELQSLKDEVEEKMRRILELNEENRTLNDMINMLRTNQSLKWTKKEREEYEFLKQRVKLLEQGKSDTDNITSNLQTAVDLYVDTIELLEASENKLKAEIEQYRGLNETLHENILSMRQEIEDMKKTFQQEIDDQKWINFILHLDSADVQHTNQIYSEQIKKYQNLYHHLMELNYELETEHVYNLQDLSLMEAQCNKYQSFYKIQEEEKIVIKNQLKKLTKKNKCYEEVVQFFKEEMSVMSHELLTLQEVLNVNNVSSQDENNKLIGAILQLRRINDRLVEHLCAIEKQALLESQINQINETRINELQEIISAKNNDLTQHDDVIQDMRRKLNNATRQNTDLKNTIKNLTDTVVEIQEGIRSVERDQLKNLNDVSAVQSKVCLANGDLESIKTCMEQKNSRIVDLEGQLKSQEVELILATKELGVLKEKKTNSKGVINSLKEQLSIAEKKNKEIIGDYQLVVKKLQGYSSLQHMKNYELNHYKSLFEELKMSLVQLNNGLDKCEASNIHFYEDLGSSDHPRGRLQHRKDNLPIVFEELKRSMAELNKRISDGDVKGGLIEEELLKVKESHMSQFQEEVTDTQKELQEKITSSIEEQTRLNQLVEEQKDEIRRLQRELEEEKTDVCCKRSVSELKNEKTCSNAQMEISHLKCELNKSIHRQKLLNEENDQIHNQMINLRKKLTVLEQASDVLRQENEDNKLQLKKTTREKEYLAHKYQDLKKTMEEMKSTNDQLEKQCRYNSDCVRNLELELSETQTEKETVSSEAQELLSVVKMWLQEQNVVNGEIRGRFQSYSDTIISLRQTMMERMSEQRSWIKTPMQQPFSQRRYGTMANLDRQTASPTITRRLERHTADARYRPSSPLVDLSSYTTDAYLSEDAASNRSNMARNISYDSNSSPYTSRSPSPRSNSIHGEDDLDEMNLNDWFSPNYKESNTDAEEGEEDAFINKVHIMTAQVQEVNKRWQKKMNKKHLSKSRASNK